MTSVSYSLNASFVSRARCLGDWNNAQDRNEIIQRESGLEFNVSSVGLESVMVLQMQVAPVSVCKCDIEEWVKG